MNPITISFLNRSSITKLQDINNKDAILSEMTKKIVNMNLDDSCKKKLRFIISALTILIRDRYSNERVHLMNHKENYGHISLSIDYICNALREVHENFNQEDVKKLLILVTHRHNSIFSDITNYTKSISTLLTALKISVDRTQLMQINSVVCHLNWNTDIGARLIKLITNEETNINQDNFLVKYINAIKSYGNTCSLMHLLFLPTQTDSDSFIKSLSRLNKAKCIDILEFLQTRTFGEPARLRLHWAIKNFSRSFGNDKEILKEVIILIGNVFSHNQYDGWQETYQKEVGISIRKGLFGNDNGTLKELAIAIGKIKFSKSGYGKTEMLLAINENCFGNSDDVLLELIKSIKTIDLSDNTSKTILLRLIALNRFGISNEATREIVDLINKNQLIVFSKELKKLFALQIQRGRLPENIKNIILAKNPDIEIQYLLNPIKDPVTEFKDFLKNIVLPRILANEKKDSDKDFSIDYKGITLNYSIDMVSFADITSIDDMIFIKYGDNFIIQSKSAHQAWFEMDGEHKTLPKNKADALLHVNYWYTDDDGLESFLNTNLTQN